MQKVNLHLLSLKKRSVSTIDPERYSRSRSKSRGLMLRGVTIISQNAAETVSFAKKFARELKKGDILALIGDLGSGKTTFVKGIALGLGAKNAKYINSPSFTIIKEYNTKIPIYHFDVYRLNNDRDFLNLGFEEYFFSNGITIVEWADKIKKFLPSKTVFIKFLILKNKKRKISIQQKG